MVSFTNEQLQQVISQLDQAMYNHEQWYKNLLRLMVLQLPPEVADLEPDAHHHCRFGQWYESDQAASLMGNASFALLEEAHEKLHNSARVMLERIADDLAVHVGDWNQFDNDVDKFRLELSALHHEFSELAHNLDPLTEAQTRASLMLELTEYYALVKRGRIDCTLAMLDLDNFKRVNDTYGHAVGDTVLVATVKRLKSLLRPYDKIYRYGGEEFLICMPGISLKKACEVAERMRLALAEQRIPINGSDEKLQVTASFGIAMLNPLTSIEESINAADKALYDAKSSGRNCVVSVTG